MKKPALGMLLTGASLPTLAHEGHGVDAASALHYLSGAHLLLPVGIALLLGVCYVGIRYARSRR